VFYLSSRYLWPVVSASFSLSLSTRLPLLKAPTPPANSGQLSPRSANAVGSGNECVDRLAFSSSIVVTFLRCICVMAVDARLLNNG
jgi:hypothetical protein